MTDDQALRHLLSTFRSSAWRLEALDSYAVPEEDESFAAYLRGEPVPPPEPAFEEFLAELRSLSATGRTMGRVHAIAGPLTPYLRYEIEWGYVVSAVAGEDVRILHRPTWQQTPFGDRPPDFWLIDDVVAVMRYDASGHWLGLTLLSDPASVAEYGALRDLAVGHSLPLTDYLAAMRSTQLDPSANLPRMATTSPDRA
jgi:hypothetical protein